MRAPNLRSYRTTTGPPPWARISLIRVEPTHSSKPWRTKVDSVVRGLPIGNTPLIRLRVLEPHDRVRVFAKTEWSNAGGSVKDRAAQSMILNGLNTGQLTEGKTLVDASSGNTGLAYAMIGAQAGFPVRVYLPENVSRTRLGLLKSYGAEVVLTDGGEGMDGAIHAVSKVVSKNPDPFFYPNQYSNPANWWAHYEGTGAEILSQTKGKVTHFVAGLGTSGTLMGTGRRLLDEDPSIELIAMQPDSPMHAIEGLKHMDSALRPAIYDPGLVNRQVKVNTESVRLFRNTLRDQTGLKVGPSSAAAALASKELAQELDEGVIVTVFPDGGCKYEQDTYWEQS